MESRDAGRRDRGMGRRGDTGRRRDRGARGRGDVMRFSMVSITTGEGS
jgi:hypothetical protein